MPRKTRMILEEVEQKNDLVPGSPENPLNLGEKAKNILVKLKNAEDTGIPANLQEYGYTENRPPMERCIFLKLIETVPTRTPEQVQTEIDRCMAQLFESVNWQHSPTKEFTKMLFDAHYELDRLRNEITTPTVRTQLTDAGRALLLTGTVTISL